ncbi:MAG: class I SAM-dependent methyltransferase [Desulfovibrionales bacterium]
MFSLNPDILNDIFTYAKPLGHHEDQDKLNLGFGFLYYGLVRALRPEHILVIGSGFGFSVICLALGLKDNGRGRLTFVDPSFDIMKHGPLKTMGGRGFWSDPNQVREHFDRFSLNGYVTHHRLTNTEFFPTYERLDLPPVDLAFLDGNHSLKHIRYDFLETLKHCRKNSYLLLHDTNIKLRELIGHSGVKSWLKTIKREKECFEAVDFPFSSGVAMIRVLVEGAWQHFNLQ